MARAGLDLQTVLAAAAEIADEQGIEALTLAALAQKLSIRSPSLYNHVNGLPGLRKKLVLHGYAQMKEALTKAAIGQSGDQAVRSMASAYRDYVHRHPGVYEATERWMDRDDPEVQKAAGEVMEVVARVLESYGLKNEEAIHVMRGFRSLVHGFASIERTGGFGIPVDTDISFRVLIDIYLAGIHSRQQV